jgi:hypothetical protein
LFSDFFSTIFSDKSNPIAFKKEGGINPILISLKHLKLSPKINPLVELSAPIRVSSGLVAAKMSTNLVDQVFNDFLTVKGSMSTVEC